MLGQRGIVQKLIAGFVIFFLESKCLIEDKAAHAGKLAHFAHLLAVRCRIPDDCIDKNRYPLFMARSVLRELIESLPSTRSL